MIRYERNGDALVAVSRILVGTAEVSLAVRLGAWEGPDPDARGLAGAPVVVVPHERLVALAVAGARRSGGVDADVILEISGLGGRLLRSPAEVMVVVADQGGILAAVRALGGRPLPVLPFDDTGRIRRFIAQSPIDLDLVIPATEPARARARDAVLTPQLEATHHLVDVGPRPAFDELGDDPGAASTTELAAGAAGVLAGRVAAGARRWRPDP